MAVTSRKITKRCLFFATYNKLHRIFLCQQKVFWVSPSKKDVTVEKPTGKNKNSTISEVHKNRALK